MTHRPSPQVVSIAWGRMEVAGLGVGRDFKLYPGGGRPWNWAETGTHHHPGIQPTDVTELLDHGATTIVLSQGMERRLGICPETLETLRGEGVEVHVEETREAVEIYNALTATQPVGGLFHSTC